MNKLDLTGQRFGRLTVLCEAEPIEYVYPSGRKYNIRRWICACDCGNVVCVRQTDLRNGGTQSCGCLRKDLIGEKNKKEKRVHGLHGTRVYIIYKNMKRRCYNQRDQHYADYGGRGICICEEWRGKEGFSRFYTWAMSHGYRDDLSIDRINNDGPYAPWNCRWASRVDQARNKRSNVLIEMHGECRTQAEWAGKLSVSKGKIMYYRKKGITGDDLYEKLTENN